MPIVDYANRIFQYTNTSDSTYIIALIYIKRLLQNTTNAFISKTNAHKLMLLSCLLATKYIEDVPYNNAQWARVGGFSLAELNSLELYMLSAMQWRLYVSQQEVEHVSRLHFQDPEGLPARS